MLEGSKIRDVVALLNRSCVSFAQLLRPIEHWSHDIYYNRLSYGPSEAPTWLLQLLKSGRRG